MFREEWGVGEDLATHADMSTEPQAPRLARRKQEMTSPMYED
jgi:hypothetical protein